MKRHSAIHSAFLWMHRRSEFLTVI